jgi:Lrp/AsnC family transcriptional regulator, leucine-responsive regulatory protein
MYFNTFMSYITKQRFLKGKELYSIMESDLLPKLDLKDYEILRELDIDFRQSFSKIGKKVNLSKNSVSLRFEKLKNYMLHNLVGVNNEILGYTEVKVYYSFDFYNEDIERLIINELKKYKNVLWAARYYGVYDFCVSFLVNNTEELLVQINNFNDKFSGKINQKDMQMIFKRYYFRYNFLHQKPMNIFYTIEKGGEKIVLSEIEKKILHIIRHDPRISIVDIADRVNITPKTAATKLDGLKNKKVITGYFMTIDPVKLNYNTFKLLVQVKNLKNKTDFEKYLVSIKNVKYIVKMAGLWDYEIDFIYHNMTELQNQIDLIKEKFPNSLKKLGILSFGKRIITNRNMFLD